MKRVNIKCPYCGSRALLRPASAVYGTNAIDPAAPYYVCAQYPACDSYVAAHRDTCLPVLDGGVDQTEPLAIQETAHRQMGIHLGIPWRYYEKMLQEEPSLLAHNVNHWLRRGEPTQRMLRTLDGKARACGTYVLEVRPESKGLVTFKDNKITDAGEIKNPTGGAFTITE